MGIVLHLLALAILLRAPSVSAVLEAESVFSLHGIKPVQIKFRSTNATNPGITGCFYAAKADDTLHQMSKSMNIMMDEIQRRNPDVDLTVSSKIAAGMKVNIPCPGSFYYQYQPLHIAGCFFEYTIEETHPSLLSLVKEPPVDFGPFTIAGIWIANYQALFLDLTSDDNYTMGQRIFMPTCGHSGTLEDTIPAEFPSTGCRYAIDAKEKVMPIIVMAYAMNITLDDVLYRNPEMDAQTVVVPYSDDGSSPEFVHEVAIPCPG